MVQGAWGASKLAILGGRDLFSFLKYGLKHRDKHIIHITPAIPAQFNGFGHLARDLGSRPNRLLDIVPDLPVARGASNVATYLAISHTNIEIPMEWSQLTIFRFIQSWSC
jgi:hypothetical protein